jgi:hypothetical protein
MRTTTVRRRRRAPDEQRDTDTSTERIDTTSLHTTRHDDPDGRHVKPRCQARVDRQGPYMRKEAEHTTERTSHPEV